MSGDAANGEDGGAPGQADFRRQVRVALSHLHDFAYLQTHPFARVVRSEEPRRDPAVGKLLQRSLAEALESLRPDPSAPTASRAWRAFQILELRYREGLDVAQVQARLALGKSEYHEDHRRALDAIASLLWERWGRERRDVDGSPDQDGPVRPAAIAPPPAPAAPPAPPRSALPLPLTGFVGRERELAEVARLLASARLVTLIGPPGVGKTRLALEAAHGLADAFPDGVVFVPLAALREPDQVGPAIAQALGLRQAGGHRLLESLTDRLRDRRVLLVLDNFEQVVEAASFVGELLAAAPGPRALVTSRVTLRVRAEQRFPVPPLSVPGSGEGEDVGRSEAVRLFVERARAVKPDFALSDDQRATVAEICRRLDGLPLAIELAAARIGLLPPGALLARLGRRLDLLGGGARDLPAHQQTVERTIAWSYDLLDASERTLFCRLGEFAGGFSLEAAEAVNRAAGEAAVDVLAGLDALVNQSLVQSEVADGEPRFTILETLREYARRQLAARGETDAVRQAHADYYVKLIGGGAAPRVGVLWPAITEGQLEREVENARAALGWFLQRGEVESGLGLMALLWGYWHSQGLEGEARAWSARFLAHPEATRPAVRKAVCWITGMVAYTRDDPETAQARFAEGLALARVDGDKPGVELLLQDLGAVALERGEDEAAEALFQESLTLARERGDAYAIHDLLVPLGDSARLRGDDAAARSLYEESLRTHPADRSWALRNLVYLALHAGDLAAATALVREGLGWCRAERNTFGRVQCLIALAGIAFGRGDAPRAARLLGTLAAALDRIDAALFRPDRFERDRCLAAVRARLSETAFAEAWAEGHVMTLEQAVADGLEEGGG